MYSFENTLNQVDSTRKFIAGQLLAIFFAQASVDAMTFYCSLVRDHDPKVLTAICWAFRVFHLSIPTALLPFCATVIV